MTLRKLLRTSFILTGLLALSSCAHVEIKDHRYCGDEGSQGADCVWMFQDKKEHYDKGQWDDLRFGQICTLDDPGHEGETIADIKGELEEACSICKCCDFPQMQAVRNFFLKLQDQQSK
jgi:hypothetical protein